MSISGTSTLLDKLAARSKSVLQPPKINDERDQPPAIFIDCEVSAVQNSLMDLFPKVFDRFF